MPKILRQLFKWVVLFAVLLAGLYYLGGFSEAQSTALALLSCVILLFVTLRTQEQWPFVPYNVFVKPKLRTIVTDFELVENTEEEWAKIGAEIEKLPKAPWNIWHSGFSFSVITPQLIYQHRWNTFTTELKWSASLDPVVTSPTLELDKWGNGYRLQLVLPDDHWDRIKNRPIFAKMDKFDVNIDRMRGTVDVMLAEIPGEEFGIHVWVNSPGDSGKLAYEIVKRRKEARARHGWEGKAHTDMYDRETPADRSNSVEHKYFSLSHSSI